MKNLLLLNLLLLALPAYSLTLTPEMEKLIDSKFAGPNFSKEDARWKMEDVLNEVQDNHLPIAVDPKTGLPILDFNDGFRPPQSRPDELRACVTRSRTVCTGSGKDRTCETIEWSVCVGS